MTKTTRAVPAGKVDAITVVEARRKPNVTLREYRFKLGTVELLVPAGTGQSDALEDAGLFTNTAKRLAEELATEGDSGDFSSKVPTSVLWSIGNLLDLADAMISVAYEAMPRGEVQA